jgi:L-serine deaminase
MPAMAQKNGVGGTTTATSTGGANGIDEIVRRIEREMDRLTRDLERDVRNLERSRRPDPEQRSPQQPQ